MRIVIAPDAFKGTVSAAGAARALADGWLARRPGDVVVLRPMADGGEGTLSAIDSAVLGGERMPVPVTGPDGSSVAASWLLLPDRTGVVELASTSGIELLGGRVLPLDASTLGFGQAIVAALDHGVERLVLAIGSSASTDGGAGMLVALGLRLTDAAARPLRLDDRAHRSRRVDRRCDGRPGAVVAAAGGALARSTPGQAPASASETTARASS